MGDVHTGVWLGRRLWRPVASELLVERRRRQSRRRMRSRLHLASRSTRRR